MIIVFNSNAYKTSNMKLIFSVLFSLMLVYVTAQTTISSSEYTPRLMAKSILPPVEGKTTLQTKFLRNEWSAGKVFLPSTNRFVELPLMFDQFRNKLYYLEGQNMMAFAEPVSQFTIEYKEEKNVYTFLFKNNFPPIHSNDQSTYYEVLVDGKYSLLRCKANTIAAYKPSEVKSEDPNYDKEMFYAFLPDGKIVHLQLNKEQINSQLAPYIKSAAVLTDCNKIKNEKNLRELFISLNEMK